MFRLRLAALVAVAATGALTSSLAAPAVAAPPKAIVAFLPDEPPPPPGTTFAPQRTPILDVLDARSALSLGLMGATQGVYDREQALLDMSAGGRTSASAYDHKHPIDLNYFEDGTGNAIELGWPDIVTRADSATAEITPGLFGSTVPGGIGYAGVDGASQFESIVAADEHGVVRAPSIGPARNVARRARALLDSHSVVVAALPSGDDGARQLDSLIAAHQPGELLIVMRTPPESGAPQQLATGVLGLSDKPKGLTSTTTHQPGLVAAIDVMPTVLDFIGVKIPKDVKGQKIEAKGKRDRAALEKFSARLRVLSARRVPVLEALLITWLAVVLIGGLFGDRRGWAWGVRAGALAFCWVLTSLLVTGALAPSRASELIEVCLISFGLGILTDRFAPWPRGILIPCAVTVLAYTADLANGSHFIVRSLLGPNPRFGSRFYGLGNELEATLPILLLVAVAVLMTGRGRGRRGMYAFGVSGVVFAAVVGSGRLGADVGGVLTVAAGTAVAVLCMIPGGMSRRSIVLAILALPLAVVALAGLDLATGGNGHFTRTVLHADGSGALWDIVARRYQLAFNVLKNAFMPLMTGICAVAVAYAIRYRGRLYGAIGEDPAWRAAFFGALAASIAGTLFNDSGPMLLLFGVFVLSIVTAYLRGAPHLADERAAADQVHSGAGR